MLLPPPPLLLLLLLLLLPLFVLLSISFWCIGFNLVVACGMISIDIMDVSDSVGVVGDDNDDADDVVVDDGDDDDVLGIVVNVAVLVLVMGTTAAMPFTAVLVAECNVPVHLVNRKFGAMSSSSLLPTNELIFALEPISRICLRLA